MLLLAGKKFLRELNCKDCCHGDLRLLGSGGKVAPKAVGQIRTDWQVSLMRTTNTDRGPLKEQTSLRTPAPQPPT